MKKMPTFCALLIATAVSACERAEEKDRAAPPSDSTVSAEQAANRSATGDTNAWRTEAERPREGDASFGVVVLTDVRTAMHDGFERIVLEFDGALPGYRIAYAETQIIQCGSGDVVDLPGDAHLLIRLSPAHAHTEEGAPTVPAADQVFSDRKMLRLKQICDFEAVVEWAVAVRERTPFRVLELKAPNRLVIDIGKGE